MTEAEARKKWCPFARVIVYRERREVSDKRVSMVEREQCSANRLPNIGGEGGDYWPDARCIASDCMAWRWTKRPSEAKTVTRPPTTQKSTETETYFDDGIGRGYCGLAGKP